MTHEQRLSRLERIAKLFVKAGLRARQQGREHDERIIMLINQQIRNDEKFVQHEEKFGNHDEKIDILINQQIRNDEKFAERFAKLTESQTTTEKHLASLIDSLREGGNGVSLTR